MRSLVPVLASALALAACGLAPGALAEAPAGPSEQTLAEFVTTYYRSPDPERAPDVLKRFLTQDLPGDPRWQQDAHSLSVIAYSFGRIAQLHPGLIRRYEALVADVPEPGRRVLLSAIAWGADQETGTTAQAWREHPALSEAADELETHLAAPHPAWHDQDATAIATADELDFLWAEFFVTGSPQSLDRILRILDRPDVLRERLTAWLNNQPDQDARHVLAARLTELGVSADVETGGVNSRGDLDLTAARGLKTRGPLASQAFVALADMIRLEDAGVTHLLLKGAAAWSLESNARRHPGVVAQCATSLPEAPEGARAVLLRILADDAILRGVVQDAIPHLRTLSELTPHDPQVHERLGYANMTLDQLEAAEESQANLAELDADRGSRLELAIRYRRLERLPEPDAAAWSPADGGAQNRLSLAGERLAQADRYRTRVRLSARDATPPRLLAEWWMEHVRPDRFHVEQTAWTEGVSNRWLSIAGAHYAFFGIWVPAEDAVQSGMDYARWNRFLRVDKYAKLLERSATVETAPGPDGRHWLARVEATDWADFAEGVEGAGAHDVTLWFNEDTNLLERARVRMASPDPDEPDLVIEQLVTDYDGSIRIEAPRVMVRQHR